VEIPKEVRAKLNFITVKEVNEVFNKAIIFKDKK
jgi:ATP-dependent Lon protease